jgi:hypothetical protein
VNSVRYPSASSCSIFASTLTFHIMLRQSAVPFIDAPRLEFDAGSGQAKGRRAAGTNVVIAQRDRQERRGGHSMAARRSRAAATGRSAAGRIHRTGLLAEARAAARRRNTFQPDVLTAGLLVTDGSGPDPPVMRALSDAHAGGSLPQKSPYSAVWRLQKPRRDPMGGASRFWKRAGRPAQWGQDRGGYLTRTIK